MPAGLQIFNDSNVIQIDATFQNLALIDRGTVTTNILIHPTPASYKASVVFANCKNRVVAFRCAAQVAFTVARNGTTWTYEFISIGGQATIEYFAFDDPIEVTSFGLQVFDEAGDLVFDAGRPYMRVIDFIAGDTSVFTDPLNSFTGPGISRSYPGKKIALAQCNFAMGTIYFMQPGPPGQEPFIRRMFMVGGRTSSDSSMQLLNRLLYEDGPWPTNSNPGQFAQRGYGYLVLDVTNF